jgi:glycosyltransferase involved in cell wall biosynthesis
LTPYFPPEIGTAAHLLHDLARAFSDRGHEVVVATGFPWYNLPERPALYRRRVWMRERMLNFTVARLAMPVLGPRKLRMAVTYSMAPLATFLGGFFSPKPDVIFVYSPPMPMALAGWALSRVRRVPVVLGLQDLHPQCYIDQGVLKNRLLIRILRGLERFSYRGATAITVHSEGNRQHVARVLKSDGGKVHIVSNWVDTEQVKPLPRRNEFSRAHGLDDKLVFSYAGTMGMSQGLMTLIDSARQLRHRKDILILCVGDGIERPQMEARARALELDNVHFLPMQPKDVYPWVLASSDVSTVFLNRSVRTPTVPSKILNIMAAGRPILASVPLEGDAPRVIREANAGTCVEPENIDALAGAIAAMAADRASRERMAIDGREYVLAHCSLEQTVDRLEGLFNQLIQSTPEYDLSGRPRHSHS